MHIEELIIKTKSSENKWRLMEILRNKVLDSDYIDNRIIILNADNVRRIIIFYQVNSNGVKAVELIKSYMAGPGSKFGQVIL